MCLALVLLVLLLRLLSLLLSTVCARLRQRICSSPGITWCVFDERSDASLDRWIESTRLDPYELELAQRARFSTLVPPCTKLVPRYLNLATKISRGAWPTPLVHQTRVRTQLHTCAAVRLYCILEKMHKKVFIFRTVEWVHTTRLQTWHNIC